jgi:hypothetical protein
MAKKASFLHKMVRLGVCPKRQQLLLVAIETITEK